MALTLNSSSLESGMMYPLFLIPTLVIYLSVSPLVGAAPFTFKRDMSPMLTQLVVSVFYWFIYPSETGLCRGLHRHSSSSESPSGLVLKMFKILWLGTRSVVADSRLGGP
jgi:hypothetical protein